MIQLVELQQIQFPVVAEPEPVVSGAPCQFFDEIVRCFHMQIKIIWLQTVSDIATSMKGNKAAA